LTIAATIAVLVILDVIVPLMRPPTINIVPKKEIKIIKISMSTVILTIVNRGVFTQKSFKKTVQRLTD
jgi:hypothetical protein